MNSPYRLIIYAAIFGVIVITVIVIGFVTTRPQQSNPVPAAETVWPAPAGPTIPAAPSISFSVVESKTGNLFYVAWQNLPNGTAELNIYRRTADSAPWTFWKTVPVTPGELTNGSWSLDIGNATFSGYSFYAEALGTGGNPLGPGNDASGTPVLWTSSSTSPTDTSSTNPEPDIPPNNPPPDNTPTSTNPATPPPADNTSTPSSSNPNPEPPNSTSSNPGGGGNPSNGIPYYNPQAQLSGYGNPPGDFWVQYVNNTVELGWQGLPDGVTSITVTRSESDNGPWQELMVEGNPAPSSTYSIQIADATYNTPYYYEMTAMNGTTTIGIYGPVYLAPR